MLENYDHEPLSGFDWDKRKSESNLVKHGIDFEEAIEVFTGLSFFDGLIATMRSAGLP
jgi:hypothetical protein